MDTDTSLKILYGAAVMGAGLVGFITVFAPRVASKYIFAGDIQVDTYTRILGSLWLAIGAIAILGIIAPVTFIPILLMQLIYKSVWLIFIAYPAIILGKRETGLLFFTALFTIWVIALVALTPFNAVLPLPLE
jgi:hypothetical protein